MFIKRITLTTLIALAVLLMTASSALPAQQGDQLREEFHQSYPIAADGRVSLGNINGSVHIAGWDRNEVKVDAVKTAYTRERLDEAKIDVRSDADSIRIQTEYPNRSQTFTNGEGRANNPATVEYTLTVPRNARLDSIELINGNLDIEGVAGDVKASAINGRLSARGLTGATKLSTINGSLEAAFDRLDVSKPISVGSVNGGVSLTIPSDANAQLKANTVHGAIRNDFGLPVRDGEYVGHELAGQLGQGGVLIKLGNVNGSITIHHAADGRPLSHATSFLAEKMKDKDKDKDKDDMIDDRAEARRAAREAAGEAMRAQAEVRRAQAEAMSAQRIAQLQAQRAQAESGRDAQRIAQQVSRQEAIRARDEAKRAAREAVTANREGMNSLRLVERDSKTYQVSGMPHLNLQTFDGYIAVHAWDKQEVQVTSSKRAATEQEMRGINIRSSQTGSDINIAADFDKNFAAKVGGMETTNALVSFDVYVPRNSNVRLTSGDGHIELEGINGNLELNTSDGRIEVRDSNGRLTAKTGDGRIEVENFNGSVEVNTGDGRINLGGRFEQLNARTGGGSIVLTLPQDFNATIETDSNSVNNEGLTLTEEQGSSRRLKRWKIGQGGPVLTLHAGEGRIIVRRAGQ
ncbi:MAG: hypothetical protein DMF68_03395 [Acidobacteria bacterium]|nr:MAG: hypothetical protein DMF68_03395 [Acidobacteriota bacterium]